jgi:hypothetical protein
MEDCGRGGVFSDEWLYMPICPGSDVAIHWGRGMQVDVILASLNCFSTRMEGGVVFPGAKNHSRNGAIAPLAGRSHPAYNHTEEQTGGCGE